LTERLMQEAARLRLSDALAAIGNHYAVDVPPVERPVECLAFIAETVAAVLIELPPARVQGRLRREEAG
jgi:hypothetical protein